MTETPLVGIIMGSQSDWSTMRHAAETLETLGVPYETRIVSAHRTPKRLADYAETARGRGLQVIIAGAGGAAHLPGMTAAMTPLPVFGVPVESHALKGLDSLLSIVQMPAGVPVGTLAIGARRRGQCRAPGRGRDRALATRRGPEAGRVAQPPDRRRRRPPRRRMTPAPQRLDPGSTIGILGGGQLGRMIALAAARLGYRCHTFADTPDSPAAQVCAASTLADYRDTAALDAFAAAVDVVTLEFENVPEESVRYLAGRVPVRPGPDVLAIAQDRMLEKDFLNRIGIATAPYAHVTDLPSLEAAVARIGRPAVLKTAKFGYDGKGQVAIGPATDLAQALGETNTDHAVLEGWVDFALEISVIVGRGLDGETAAYVPVENRHVHHILDTTIAPAGIAAGDRGARRRDRPQGGGSAGRGRAAGGRDVRHARRRGAGQRNRPPAA